MKHISRILERSKFYFWSVDDVRYGICFYKLP